jgi:hypothetical protein
MHSTNDRPATPDRASPTTTAVPDNVVSHAKRVLEMARSRASAPNSTPTRTAVPANVLSHSQRVLEAARAGRTLQRPVEAVVARAIPLPPASTSPTLKHFESAPPPLPDAPRPLIEPPAREVVATTPDPFDRLPGNGRRVLQRSRRALVIGIDGVLHPISAIAGATAPMTPAQLAQNCPQALMYVARLGGMLKGHEDVAVVVSSSWSAFFDDEQMRLLMLPLAHWFAGSVGQLYKGRDIAIRDWVSSHHQIRSIAVLDDIKNFFPGSMPELIGCSPQHGLGDAHVRMRLRHWLHHGVLLS